ncbi:CDP-glycerol--poly(glycerophosphate) glycerophosphotransferase [Brumicola nitratireducens]|uniref:Putative CDP-glycerol:poly(Glycerophosphate) glycerophosphotransferase n=1 Tax=Glaciecola nitratireducens (strain JCM 12485 / KCTC 12276 / FR1064) TaxID=1085623 RepID=G4QM69_GLANF|nr:CDP-glycerol--poly(glycerophosphate) glycerophosphotransferase [Glaciecola nitratireducens]AEP30640.1 putative CDP-glycerol:poly(glycerophosphate) glycerophosphotransferase [Glaciecola nitratireducens FR1064]
MIFSDGGDYFEEFAVSDGIIQDCGSYLVEYFYTLKPQCYLLKSPCDIDTKFVELGKQCLSHCYLAYNQKEIINFIEKIILGENDPKQKDREKFAQQEIMINHPYVAKEIVNYFEKFFIGTK